MIKSRIATDEEKNVTSKLPRAIHIYRTRRGLQVCGDSRGILRLLLDSSVDLIMTSPPFALLHKKIYGNEEQAEYVVWLREFSREAHRVLKDTGSFVIDIGGAYERSKPIRSLYNFRVLMDFCDNLGYRLAQELFWYNPAKLPSPTEWVNRRKIRVKDSVNTIWWLSKTDHPKADTTKVLVPYSEHMKDLIKNSRRRSTPERHPSGHCITPAISRNNGGAIPSNLLQIANTDSKSHYLRTCRLLGKEIHPARFPAKLPEFFIRFLTDPGDIVVDIFSGSNTTGFVAERLGRRWLATEIERDYAVSSAIRFMEGWEEKDIRAIVGKIERGNVPVLDKRSSMGSKAA